MEAGAACISLVEPNIDVHEELFDVVLGYPDVSMCVLTRAVGSIPGEKTFYVPVVSNCASLREPTVPYYEKTTVEVHTLHDTMAEVDSITGRPVDTLVIDTQGTELDVLLSMDMAELGPTAVIVESCSKPDNELAAFDTDIIDLMTDSGYVIANTWVRSLREVQRFAYGKGLRETEYSAGNIYDRLYMKRGV